MPVCLRSCAGESSPFVVEAATFLPLLYLSICTYRSLFKFKLFGDFSLKVGSHQHRHPLSRSDLPITYPAVPPQELTNNLLPFLSSVACRARTRR